MSTLKKILIPLILTLSLHAGAMSPEMNTSVGAQTSWPVTGQFGVGAALNFPLTSLIFFPYLSFDVNGVEYLDKKVYYREINYGAGAKLLLSSLIYRGTLGRMYRMYEKLVDESWRAELGFGTIIQNMEITLNYRHYYPLEKRAVVITIGWVF